MKTTSFKTVKLEADRLNLNSDDIVISNAVLGQMHRTTLENCQQQEYFRLISIRSKKSI